MTYFLHTERIRMRAIAAVDAMILYSLDQDPEVLRHIGRKPPTLEHVTERTIPALHSMYEKTPGLGFWIAEDRETDESLGWFHLKASDEEGVAEIGYRLKRSAWGKGFATEGSLALIRYGFEEQNLDAITAIASVDNEASRHVLEKCGLVWEQDLPYHDAVMKRQEMPALTTACYRLRAADWVSPT